jgi:hypothetical protein
LVWGVAPATAQTGVSATTRCRRVSEPIDATTLSTSTFITNPANVAVPSTVSWDAAVEFGM